MSLPMFEHFPRTIGGYDSNAAQAVLDGLRATIADLEDQFQKADNEVRRLERKLLERQRSRPKFAELGSAFENAIRLAEEQATTLVSDAETETRAQLSEVKSNSVTALEAARLDARNAIANANHEADQIRLRADQEAVHQRQLVASELKEVQVEAQRVDQTAAAVLASAEARIAELRAAANAEITEAMREAKETLREAEARAGRIDAEVATFEKKANADIATILKDGNAYATETRRDADEHTELSYKRADDVHAEATHYVTDTQERAQKALDEARARSEAALAGAEKITLEITERSQDFVANLTRDLEDRLAKARRNLEDISGFLYQIRMLTNGFDLGELSVARNRVASENETVSIAEILED